MIGDVTDRNGCVRHHAMTDELPWPHRDGFKKYVRSIVLRNNTLTGRLYRDEPAILAWDLVNEPFNYGDDSGKVLTVSI